MLKLPDAQKKIMISQYKTKLAASQTKQKESGSDWSKKFNTFDVKWNVLKEFEVVLKDSDKKFAEDFIQELGLKRLCRVSREHKNPQFDTQILTVFKAIIDASPAVEIAMIIDDQTISTIVSKVQIYPYSYSYSHSASQNRIISIYS